MGLFNRKPKTQADPIEDTRVEVVVSKEANQEMFDKAKKASRTLNELLEANHFTIKIYKAAGGKTKTRKVV